MRRLWVRGLGRPSPRTAAGEVAGDSGGNVTAEIVRAFAMNLGRLDGDVRRHAEQLILRLLVIVKDIPLTGEMDAALSDLGAALREQGSQGLAAAVASTRAEIMAPVRAQAASQDTPASA